MELWMLLLLVLLYGLVGLILTLRAYRFLRKPGYTYTYTPLLAPKEFKPEGERWRRMAAWYWYVGALIIVILWMAA